MNYSGKSLFLVTVQMVGILVILATGPLFPRQLPYLLIELTGGAIGVWAVLTMRYRRFSVLPDVKAGATLVQQGPYRWVRHPMYLAVLLVTGALVAAAFSWGRLVVWLILVVDIFVKIQYEEHLLRMHYPSYPIYQQQTKRLLPGLY
jgi:protein-S-isoprenylcysteine O-methyltransferase Ste14